MSSKYSDTIAREQQVREINDRTKEEIPSTVRKSYGNEIFIVAIIQILFAILLLGRFTITDGSFLQELYHVLIDTSNQTFNEIPTFFQKIR